MKLVFAIIHNEDSKRVVNELNANGFSVTKLSSTGGFLKSGNTTLLVGVEKEKVDEVFEIIRKNSKSRKHILNSSMISGGMEGMFMPFPAESASYSSTITQDGTDGVLNSYSTEVMLGGAIIFVIDVERFEKV